MSDTGNKSKIYHFIEFEALFQNCGDELHIVKGKGFTCSTLYKNDHVKVQNWSSETIQVFLFPFVLQFLSRRGPVFVN